MAYLQQQQLGDLGKLRISFRHPFGKKSIFGKGVRLVGKVAKVAVPIAAGGLALKFAAPFIGKGIRSAAGLFRRRAPGIPPAPNVTPPSPDQLPNAPATVAEMAAQVGATSLLQNAGLLPGAPPPAYNATVAAAPAGVPDGTESPTAPTETATGPMEAGMFGGGGSGKTLLILSAVGLGALMLSKRR